MKRYININKARLFLLSILIFYFYAANNALKLHLILNIIFKLKNNFIYI